MKNNETKKKICVAITNRTNYSKLKYVLLELQKHNSIEIKIVASSSILLEKYGKAYRDIENDGFIIDKKIDCILLNDSHESMAKTAGLSIIEHATYFSSSKPDILVIVGDRFDIMGPVMPAAMMNVPIAHIQGGEISGTIDNVIRDIVTKFATLHFVSTEKSKEKLVQWGVNARYLFNYGCPAVEYIRKIDVGTCFDSSKIKKQFKRDIDIKPGEKYFLVMVHPDTTNKDDIHAEVVLSSVESFGLKTFVFYPNLDANNSNILSAIAKFRKNEKFYMVRHMPLEGFIHTIAHSCCMVGNSSAGIREAASFGVPVINIGSRQNGRERNGNVVDVECNHDKLSSELQRLMCSRFDKKNLYYQKDSAKRIAKKILEFISV